MISNSLHIKNAMEFENHCVGEQLEGVSGWYLPWAEGCSHAWSVDFVMPRLRQEEGMGHGKLPASSSHYKRPRGAGLYQMSIWIRLCPPRISGKFWELAGLFWKIDMITVCLDSSVQQVVFIPKSVTWKGKKLTYLYQFPKESIVALGNLIFHSRPVGFFL